jgi:ADP-ribosyl-[dinitrogen reductase] hydrolase
MINKIKGALFGLAVGDALGVPVEFKTRDYLKFNRIKGITGYGTWNQPAGTWSDDSSLAFCLAESLIKGYDLNDIAQNFISWRQNGYWGAHNKVFDVGNATFAAISRLMKGISPNLAGGIEDSDNGNGSLMRIMPLLFSIKDLPIDERYKKIKEVSSITHAHFRSVFACFIYLEFALQILNENTIDKAYTNMQALVKSYATANDFNPKELQLFSRVLDAQIKDVKEDVIHSGGYVLHTLEASLWCLFNTDNYADAVLKAVNLGGDTDTTGCVTGGLAGLLYGCEEIFEVWINEIARKGDIDNLCNRLHQSIMV